MRIYISFILFWASLLSVGCQTNAMDTGAPVESTASPIVEPIFPNTGEPQMTPTLPADAGLQFLIDKSMADLAQRLAVSIDEIILLEATSVVWPDASLGCPQEGMAYAQVLTPGYLIRLRSGGQEFEYHSSRGTEVVYCENPMPPVEGTPGDV